MSKEKIPFDSDLGLSLDKKLSDTNCPKPKSSSTEDIKHAYPPHMRTNYHPSDESVESATGVDFPVNMPNPAVDSIAVNNISTWEFDYTEDDLD